MTAWPHTVCSIARLHPQHPPRTSATCNRRLSASQQRPIDDKLVGHLFLLYHQRLGVLIPRKEARNEQKMISLAIPAWVSTTYWNGTARFPHMDIYFISRSGIMGVSAPFNQSNGMTGLWGVPGCCLASCTWRFPSTLNPPHLEHRSHPSL